MLLYPPKKKGIVGRKGNRTDKEVKSRYIRPVSPQQLTAWKGGCSEEAKSGETEAILPWSVHRDFFLAPKKNSSFRLFFFLLLLFALCHSLCLVCAFEKFPKVQPLFYYLQITGSPSSWVPERRRPPVRCGRESPTMAWAMSRPRVKTFTGMYNS